MKDQNVQVYSNQLRKLGIEHNLFEHPQLISVAEVQKYLGYGMDDSAATLLMKAGDQFVAIIRRGDTKLDSEKVKKLLGVTTLRMATDDEFTTITRVPSGAASVYLPDIPTYIDEKIFEKEYINAGSGSLLVTIRYKSEDLKKIPDIQIVNITTREHKTSASPTAFEMTKQTIIDSHLPHEFIYHPPIKTVEEGLAFLGIDASRGVSTLIFQTEKGTVAVLRRDDHQLSEDKLKQELAVTALRMCQPKEVLRLTGCEIGYVTPYNPDCTVLMDKTILEKEFVYLGTGSPEYDLKIAPKDLITFTKATVCDVIETGVVRTKRRMLSGITPSGDGCLHIANHLGAVRQFIQMAKAYECFLFVADFHALTTVQNKEQLQKNVETLILEELSLLKGFLSDKEFENLTFFRQSDIGLHPELQTILNNVTPFGLLKRAHAYKDKLQKDVAEEEVNLGLFNYPILMAADILMYKPDLVPVGKDQKQHIEITRDIAERFNKTYKTKTFKLPDGYIPEEVAVIMGTDGKRKMSKSLGNIISIFDDEEIIKKQVMGCYTDPTRKHATDPGHVEGNMVFTYLDFFGDRQQVTSMKEEYKKGKISDIAVKEYLFESLMKTFTPARKRYEELRNQPEKVREILKRGAEHARTIAEQTIKEVREVTGITNRYSFGSPFTVQSSQKDTISIDEFARIEIRVGKVITAENIEKSDKLIRLTVNIGTKDTRTILTGVRDYGYTPEDFTGKQFFFVVNLAPRRMMGEESQGMILAVDSPRKASGEAGGLELPFGKHGSTKPIFISAEGLPIGAKIR